MDYQDACEAIVARVEAVREIKAHDNYSVSEFFLEYGDREEYQGRDVLEFLDY